MLVYDWLWWGQLANQNRARRYAEVRGGARRCAEGCVEVHGGVQRCAEVRGGTRRCAEGLIG